jgi:hypothetical protein
LPEESYAAWTSTYHWKKTYGHEYLYAGPLFVHQLPHLWIDFREIQDDYMRDKSMDYFENSRRATYVQREYAIKNPFEFKGYGADCWGITASDGPGFEMRRLEGIDRLFLGYHERGAPYGPDDGTISPWSVAASLPFAPEIVQPAFEHFHAIDLDLDRPYGFKASFNPTYPDESGRAHGWVSRQHFGLDQGPIVLAIEYVRSGLIWRSMRGCPYPKAGLRRAGFRGGWL